MSTEAAPAELPFSAAALAQVGQIRSRFESGQPLAGFVVVDDFLSPELLDVVRIGLARADVATYCSYTADGDPKNIRHGFHEPSDGHSYVTVHERPTQPVAELEVLRRALRAPAAVGTLAAMTGLGLEALLEPDALTCWGPGAFIARHSDFGNEDKRLVISLSLTDHWSRDYGGVTSFQWEGQQRRVEMVPKLNTATLFVPHAGSTHWVDQVDAHAPPRTRFTWTLYYR